MTKEEIRNWCFEHGVVNYIINEDLSVDIHSHVNLSFKKINELPFKLRKVTGDFNVANNFLTTLEKFPVYVMKDLYIIHNEFNKRLKISSINVGGNIWSHNHFRWKF